MIDKNEQFKLILSALLHDIGKFRQRTGLPLNDYDWQVCCPESNGYRHHLHAGHTGQFLADITKKTSYLEQEFFDIASLHHLSLDKVQNVIKDKKYLPFYAMIKKADQLSSGHERKTLKNDISEFDKTLLDNTADIDNELDKQQQDYIRARLESIFQQVNVENKTEKMVYPLEKLTDKIIPIENVELGKDESVKEYNKLWQEFDNEFKKVYKRMANDDYSHQLLAYLSLLEKYTWCIPSSAYKTAPNVSLYDHLKLTASITDALYVYHNTKATLEPKDILTYHPEARFRLIQGDFSGIQNFIFNKAGESNKFAAKILRARSFLVSLATELTAKKICEEIGITEASIIMSAGGKFTILAPNLDNIDEIIENVTKEVNKDFEKRTFGQTKMFITSVELKEEDFSNINVVFKQLTDKLTIQKHHPKITTTVFSDYIQQDKEIKVCPICGWHTVEEKYEGCNYCKEYKELGENLIKAKYLIISSNVDTAKEKKQKFLGYFYSVFAELDGNKIIKELDKKSIIFTFNSEDTLDGNVVLPIKRITTNLPSIKKEDLENLKYKDIDSKDRITESDFKNNKEAPKTFEYIARDALKDKNSEKIKGKAFLGILKADIDNLGYIFAKGFTENIYNFSLITSLSRMIDYFFSGWLLSKIKKDYQDIYTVFAGGDDLFLIGPYTDVFQIAKEINEHLQKYTGHHDDFHLSMGIALAKPMIPVYQLNELAETQLEKSKQYKDKVNGKTIKNAFSMFDQTVSWKDFEALMNIQSEIDRIEETYKEQLKEEGISTQYLYRILKFADMKENIDKNDRNKMWEPLFHYITAKNYNNYNDSEEGLKTDLLNFSKHIKKWGNRLIIPLSMMIYRERE
jgi:CRISPR-associated protein Csm1